MPELEKYLIDLRNGFTEYLGYGLGFTQDKNNWVIEYIMPGGYAGKVRLRTGDIIVSVNDKPAKDQRQEDYRDTKIANLQEQKGFAHGNLTQTKYLRY